MTEKVDLTPFSTAEKAEFKIYQLQNIIAFQGIFSVFSSGLFLGFFSVSNDVFMELMSEDLSILKYSSSFNIGSRVFCEVLTT